MTTLTARQKQTAVPRALDVRCLRLGFFGLPAPLAARLIVDATVVVVAWLTRGFKGAARDEC